MLSDAPVERLSLLPERRVAARLARSQRAVSSRAAENLFWLGRYAERSENGARLLRAVLCRLPDADAFPGRAPSGVSSRLPRGTVCSARAARAGTAPPHGASSAT